MVTLNSLNIISILIVIIIIITIIYFLLKTNRKLREKMIYEKYKFLIFKKRIDEIKKLKDNRKIIKKINKLTKSFFKERFNYKNNLTYLELSEKFKKAGKKDYEDYCNFMSHLVYSGRNIDTKDIKRIIDTFEKLIDSD